MKLGVQFKVDIYFLSASCLLATATDDKKSLLVWVSWLSFISKISCKLFSISIYYCPIATCFLFLFVFDRDHPFTVSLINRVIKKNLYETSMALILLILKSYFIGYFIYLLCQILDFWNSKIWNSACAFEWKVFFKNYLLHWFWFQLFPSLIVLWCEVASTLFLWSSSLESALPNDFRGCCSILRGYCRSHIVGDSMKLILFLLVRVYPLSTHPSFIKSWLLEISQQPFLNFLSWVKEPLSSRAWLWPLLS